MSKTVLVYTMTPELARALSELVKWRRTKWTSLGAIYHLWRVTRLVVDAIDAQAVTVKKRGKR